MSMFERDIRALEHRVKQLYKTIIDMQCDILSREKEFATWSTSPLRKHSINVLIREGILPFDYMEE